MQTGLVLLGYADYSQYLCNDGIHPNEEGHKLIAEAIKRHVDDRNIEFQ